MDLVQAVMALPVRPVAQVEVPEAVLAVHVAHGAVLAVPEALAVPKEVQPGC